MSSLQPAPALQARIIAVLTSDTDLHDLLYPDWSPALSDPGDTRVYGADAYIPEAAAFRQTLPRVLVGCQQGAHDREQEDVNVLNGPVVVTIRSLCPKDREYHVERIDARIAALVLSTLLSDASIIAAGLAADGLRTKGQIPAFDTAWEIVSRYRSQNVGVLT